ncbi:MAG: right-handed parallel beta-helix repeat-containing protein [Lentisphaeria bacterium]|nr:right-handed parallel beta-helix repeat-containing protein [Lentisphaeria bacterium]
MINLKDCPSLQSAVDAAERFDVIVVPPGDWHCGAARLKSDLVLRLEKGARLIAPERLEAYLPAERLIRCGRSLTHFFLGLSELENVTLEGEGAIELNGHCFWQDYDGLAPQPRLLERGEDGFFKSKLYAPAPYRPVGIWMENCRNIRLRGVTLRNSAAYTVWPVGCEHLEIDRVTIDNDRRGPNTDGLDIDGCRDVLISDCRISGGDDCIAVKSDRALIGDDRPCERIRIRGNILSSYCCGVRLGFEGDNPIRDVLASDNVITDSNVGYDLLSVIPAGRIFGIEHGTPIENAVFTGCVMRNVRQPLKIWSGAVSPEDASRYTGYVRHVHFSDMEIEATDSCFLGGADVSDISLASVNLRVMRDPRVYRGAVPVEMPTLWGRGYMPDPLTVYNVRDLRKICVRVTVERGEP